MRIRKPVAGLALAVSALTGAGVGAVALSPTLASAQENPSTTDQADQPDNDQANPNQPDQDQAGQEQEGQEHEGRGRHHGPKLEAAAQAIGISVDELRGALQNGQTVAQVAQAHNVSVDTVVDAMVADAREHITAFVNGERPERDEGDRPEGQQAPNGQQDQDDQPAAGS